MKKQLFLILIFGLIFLDCGKEQNTKPTASFIITPTNVNTNTIFQVNASVCSDKEDKISDLQIRWDWENDGTWDTNYLKTKTATHSYNTIRTFTMKLEVKDTGGLTGSVTKQVSVSGVRVISPNEMVLIPAGDFSMGSDTGYTYEKPVHTVYLDAYYIGKYEVTNGEYKKFIDAGGYNNQTKWTQCNI